MRESTRNHAKRNLATGGYARRVDAINTHTRITSAMWCLKSQIIDEPAPAELVGRYVTIGQGDVEVDLIARDGVTGSSSGVDDTSMTGH